MKKYIKWGIVTLIFAGMCTLEYIKLQPRQNEEIAKAGKENKGKGNKALEIHARVAVPQRLVDELPIIGRLVPDEEVMLSFETSGKITGIYFTEGCFVKKGTLLAKVNDAELQAQLTRLEAQVPLAEERVRRQSTLLQRDAVSKEALEIVKTELATLNADIDKVKAQIGQTELRAPFDGIIGLRQVSVGSYASPSTIIAKHTSVKPIKVEFSIPERYAGSIAKGTPLEFNTEGRLDTLSAKVYAKEASIDANTHTLLVRALHPNSDGSLMAGQYARIRLKQNEIENAIVMPAEAIIPEMGKKKVYIYSNGKAMPRDVITGLRTESEIQIIQGIEPGDTVITSGTLQLRKGSKVKITAFQ